MHPFSTLRKYYNAIAEGDLSEVEKWSVSVGINGHFSNGKITCFCCFNLNFDVDGILFFSLLL